MEGKRCFKQPGQRKHTFQAGWRGVMSEEPGGIVSSKGGRRTSGKAEEGEKVEAMP